MSKIIYALNDVACTGCIGKIKRGIQKSKGINTVAIVTCTGKIEIDFNENIIHPEEITKSLKKMTLRTFD